MMFKKLVNLVCEEEIEEMEYKQAVLENESIDDIFAEVEGIDDIPIISLDADDKKRE